jgi:Domain of unknown function (DUF4936)
LIAARVAELMPELYIYWRVVPAQLAQAITATQAMQASLCTRLPGLTAKLLVRRDDAAAQHTLMEVYQNLPCVTDRAVAIQAVIETAAQTALLPYQQGQRHVEVFAEVLEPATARAANAPAASPQR